MASFDFFRVFLKKLFLSTEKLNILEQKIKVIEKENTPQQIPKNHENTSEKKPKNKVFIWGNRAYDWKYDESGTFE